MANSDSYSGELRIDEEKRLVIMRFEGPTRLSAAREMVHLARSKAHELSYDILYDLRDARVNVPISDMYYFAREHPDLVTPKARRTRVACVVPSAGRKDEDWEFFENTATNAGLNWRGFRTLDEAMDWLGRGTSPAADDKH